MGHGCAGNGEVYHRPLNRYRPRVAKGVRWRAHGPVMAFFRAHAVDDFFSGGFDGEGELLMLVHGQLNPGQASSFVDRLQRVGSDFAQQHLADQKLQPRERSGYTLVVGMRNWFFAGFHDLMREAA